MKSSVTKRFKAISLVYRMLIVFLVLLGILIAGGTVYGLFFRVHSNSPGDMASNLRSKPSQNDEQARRGQTFTGIGQIRVSTKDLQPGTVILFVSFTYYPEDKAFSEELVLRVGEFQNIIRDYLGSFSTSELRNTSEEKIKAELLRRFNTILRLGHIELLYFSDYMLIE